MRFLSAIVLFACPAFAFAAPWAQVAGGKVDEANAVCVVPIKAGDPAAVNGVLAIGDKTVVPVQLTHRKTGDALVFVIPQLKAGATLNLEAPVLDLAASTTFKFVEDKGHHTDLLYGNRTVLRYINAAHDPKDHFFTFKPFHHVYDPATGKVLLTSGATKTNKEGTYPHHRGLFFGWNKITYDGKAADIWHGTNDVFSQHDKTLHEEAGPAFGRQVAAISWHGKDGQTFISEERELIAYAV